MLGVSVWSKLGITCWAFVNAALKARGRTHFRRACDFTSGRTEMRSNIVYLTEIYFNIE